MKEELIEKEEEVEEIGSKSSTFFARAKINSNIFTVETNTHCTVQVSLVNVTRGRQSTLSLFYVLLFQDIVIHGFSVCSGNQSKCLISNIFTVETDTQPYVQVHPTISSLFFGLILRASHRLLSTNLTHVWQAENQNKCRLDLKSAFILSWKLKPFELYRKIF